MAAMVATSGRPQNCGGKGGRWPLPSWPPAFILLLPIALLLLQSVAPAADPITGQLDPYAEQRRAMVAQQIRGRDIDDPEVLRALTTVPRHLFVPERLQEQAYIDFPLPIGHGQTISQPYIVAYMTQAIRSGPHQRVLEIGTGSGYQAAILAEVVDRVYSVEIVPELAQSAARRLRDLGYARVETREGDGYYGWPEAGPFDAIVVTAAAEFIPPPLLEQLKDGGRLLIPVGSPFQVQHLTLVEKKDGRLATRILLPVRFVPLRRSK